jgi:hypothetical protein
MLGFQQSTQTLDAEDFALVPFVLRLDDPVETLVNPLLGIVLEILGQDVAELFFGGEDEMIETFLSDGPHEPLRVGVQIRTASKSASRVSSVARTAARPSR